MNFLVSLDSEIPQNFVVAVLDYCLQLVPVLLLFPFPCYSILLAIFDWIYVLNQSRLCSRFFWTNLLITCLLFSSAFLHILHLLFFFLVLSIFALRLFSLLSVLTLTLSRFVLLFKHLFCNHPH